MKDILLKIKEMDSVLKNFTNLENTLKNLRAIRDSIFPELVIKTNTICNFSPFEISTDSFKYCIEQYSCFSNEAIHMLLDARINVYEWKFLANEVDDNIKEELGKFTKGVPHLVMMKNGYGKDLSISTDAVIPAHFTSDFNLGMRKLFKTPDPSYLAGALVAFEGTAISEFYIMEQIMKYYLKGDLSGVTSEYIKGHQEFEVGHEQHLVDSIEIYITNDNYQKMCHGYLDVCFNLNYWWKQLSDAVMDMEYSNYIKN